MKNTQTSVSDVETQMEWRLRAAACTETEGNPFKLDDTVLDKTLKSAPPLHKTEMWKKRYSRQCLDISWKIFNT